MKTTKAQLPRYRMRSGWDLIAKRHFAEVIRDGELVKTFFARNAEQAERCARNYIAELQR